MAGSVKTKVANQIDLLLKIDERLVIRKKSICLFDVQSAELQSAVSHGCSTVGTYIPSAPVIYSYGTAALSWQLSLSTGTD